MRRIAESGPSQKVLDELSSHKDEMLSVIMDPGHKEGVFRNVYFSVHMPNAVFKVEAHGQHFCNVQEWKTWNEVRDTQWSGYFAPCIEISYSGNVLVMARTKPITKFPKDLKLPDFFIDVKPENFGLLKGRIVCHDYGGSRIFERGLRNAKLKPASAL